MTENELEKIIDHVDNLLDEIFKRYDHGSSLNKNRKLRLRNYLVDMQSYKMNHYKWVLNQSTDLNKKAGSKIKLIE